MQFTSLFTILAVAMTASALPSEVAPRANQIASCNSQSQNACCDGLADCLVIVAGSACKGEAYCCDTSGIAQGGLINVNAANCLNIA